MPDAGEYSEMPVRVTRDGAIYIGDEQLPGCIVDDSVTIKPGGASGDVNLLRVTFAVGPVNVADPFNRRRRRLSRTRRMTTCRHANVISDGRCLHYGADLSAELAAATRALNAEIDRQFLGVTHSPSNTPPSTGRGVQIATNPAPAPRHGGLSFFCTTSPQWGV